MDELDDPARTAVEQCLDLRPGESFLVVTDDQRLDIAHALYRIGRDITDDASIIRSVPGTEHGAEPPDPVAGAMRESDVFLAPTTKSISHTEARRNACANGSRGATLPGITKSVFISGLDADYEAIRSACERVAAIVAEADEIRVEAPAGTDITFTIGERAWKQDTGIVHDAGGFSNLPAGEVFVSPVSATGTYVVDGTIRPHGLVGADSPVTIEVDDGYAVDIDDPAVAESFETAATEAGQDVYNVAELGIGTNTAVHELVGSVLLDEKAGGTVHIALGDDASIGGTTSAPIHADGVIRNPTVTVDGETLDLPGTK